MLSASVLLSILTNEDPFGGMSLSSSCIESALIGAAYSMPLVFTSILGRAPRIRRSFGVLEALHDCQERLLDPLLKGVRGVRDFLIHS
jgi:hypothetical protein